MPEAIATGAAGAALGGLALSRVGLAPVGAAVGGLNGLISGWRQIYDWGRPSGWTGFVLDSTWGLIGTTSSLVLHAIQLPRTAYRAGLSRRRGRHVYGTGFSVRKGFAVTVGNSITNIENLSGEVREELLERHEMAHVWQHRLLGPLFPTIYGLWMIGGAAAGVVLALKRGEDVWRTIDTIAYYDNPLEYLAYRRHAAWPPPRAMARYAWARRTPTT